MIILYLAIFVLAYFILQNKFFDIGYIVYPNPVFDYISSLGHLLYLVVIIIAFGLISTGAEFVLAFFISKSKLTVEKRKIYIHNYINSTLFTQFSSETNVIADINYIKTFKKKFKSDYPKLVFINRLRRIMILTRGETNLHAIRLFYLMNAERLIKSYLLSPYPRHNLFALKVIGEFQLVSFSNMIEKRLQHRNQVVASEAMYAYTRLQPMTDFTFLIKRKRALSKLDIMNLACIASNYTNIDYNALILSEIPMVSCLGIKLAGQHNVISVKHLLRRKMFSENYDISNEAQTAFLKMVDNEDTDILINDFELFNEKNQSYILTLLSNSLNTGKVEKLFSKIIEESNYPKKLEALQWIIEKDIVKAYKYRNHNNEQVMRAFEQVTDFFI